jgi:glycosyltransferase involved in cell wall biosynthesis
MEDKIKQKDFCNILYLAKDKEITNLNSLSSSKINFLSKNLGELHVVYPGGMSKKVEKRGEHFFVYPTRFKFKLGFIIEAIRIAFFQVTWRFHFRAQLVCVEDPVWTGLSGYFIAMRKRRPLVVQVGEDVLAPLYRFSSVSNFFASLVAGFVISHANYVVVSSNRIKQSILSKYKFMKDVVEVVPRAIDPEKISKLEVTKDAKNLFTEPGFIITMVGPFLANKRIKIAFDIYKRILKRYPRTNLLLIGDGPGVRFIKRISSSGRFEGKIANCKIDENFHSLLRTSHLFLVTSNYEDSDGYVVDALFSGLPVVSTDTGIVREIFSGLKYERYVCGVNETNEIFNKILELIENVGVRDDFRLNARDLISQDLIVHPDTWSKIVSGSLIKVSRMGL